MAVKDHFGVSFESVEAMCKAWNADVATFCRRRERGWSLREALSAGYASPKSLVYDHLGNDYPSVAGMCRAYGVNYSTYQKRRERGQSVKESLLGTAQVKPRKKGIVHSGSFACKDHVGRVFKNRPDMCEFYHISVATFRARMRCGWSLEEALTIPIDTEHKHIRKNKLYLSGKKTTA